MCHGAEARSAIAERLRGDDDAVMTAAARDGTFVVSQRPAVSPRSRRGSVAAAIAIMGAAWGLAGCTDSFRVEAPYDWTWEQSMSAMTAAGFQMVVEPDNERLLPASSAATGRAWFLSWPAPGSIHPSARIITISIEPVLPKETAWRTITVKAQDRSWVARADVPDPELRTRVTWILREALAAPGGAAPDGGDR